MKPDEKQSAPQEHANGEVTFASDKEVARISEALIKQNAESYEELAK